MSAKRFELGDDYGCGDGSCVFGHRGGMHTNGGCRCLYIPPHTANPAVQMRRVEKGIRQMRADYAALESALRACVGVLVGCKATLEVCYESSTGSLDKVLRDEHLNVVTALAAAREVLK